MPYECAPSGTRVIIDPIRKLARSNKGATAVEYGLIVSLIVIAIIAALSNFATNTIEMWNGIAQNVLAH